MPANYYAVPSVATGDWITAGWVNTYIGGNMSALFPYQNAGDIAYALSASELARLPIGAAYKFLQTGSGAPVWGGLSYVSIYHSTTQNLSNGTSTALLFDSENFDAPAWHDGSNPSRITVPNAGDYMAGWNFNYPGASGSGDAYFDDIEIALNGTTFHFERHHGKLIDPFTKYYAGTSRIKRATAGQYFEIWVNQRSTSTRPVAAGAEFTLLRVG